MVSFEAPKAPMVVLTEVLTQPLVSAHRHCVCHCTTSGSKAEIHLCLFRPYRPPLSASCCTMADTENVAVPFFKKKGRGRPTTSRKRSASPPATATTVPVPSSSKSEVVLPSRKSTANLLSAGTKRTISQRQEDDEEDTREGPDVKWTAAGSHVNAALEILEGDEAEALLAKRLKSEKNDEDEDVPDDGLYRGQKAYKSHIRKNKEVPKAMRVGPQRSNNSTIRTVTIVDYQPDVCKDYKGMLISDSLHSAVINGPITFSETGYCGYGDTCKFLHDRGTCEYTFITLPGMRLLETPAT